MGPRIYFDVILLHGIIYIIYNLVACILVFAIPSFGCYILCEMCSDGFVDGRIYTTRSASNVNPAVNYPSRIEWSKRGYMLCIFLSI